MMVSGGVGAPELLVKHDNAVKLAFNQTSPPSRGAGLWQRSTDGRGRANQYAARGGPASAGWTHCTGPFEGVQFGTWFSFVTCYTVPNFYAKKKKTKKQ